MIPDDPRIDAFFDRLKKESWVADWSDMGNSLVMAAIGGALAFWAYGTIAHSLLFAFVIFAVSAVGNRVTGDIRLHRAQDEGRRLGRRPPSPPPQGGRPQGRPRSLSGPTDAEPHSGPCIAVRSRYRSPGRLVRDSACVRPCGGTWRHSSEVGFCPAIHYIFQPGIRLVWARCRGADSGRNDTVMGTAGCRPCRIQN